MSCGSHTCNATYSNIPARDIKAAACRPWLARLWSGLGAWIVRTRRRQLLIELQKARQRGILLELDDRLLQDIGVTREEARREARKPFWK
jgi:uncharacterized protein YjiS (DUF1127 family)